MSAWQDRIIVDPGSSETEVLRRAMSQERILLTFDKDFGELAFQRRMGASSGVVLFRNSPASPQRVAQTAVAALHSRADWTGHLAVVKKNRIRLTPLPAG